MPGRTRAFSARWQADVVAALYAEQDRYLGLRYADVLDGYHLDGPISFANRLEGARVATAGRGGVFFQYGFYGTDLSNHVQWVGRPGAQGAWLPARSCAAFRRQLNEGGYDYVITTYDGRIPGADRTSTERRWVRHDPAARHVLAEGPVAVYRLDGPLDPDGCR